ncbi:MAG: hypothetical protein AAGI24_01645 [Pseudomonadota bacterium]
MPTLIPLGPSLTGTIVVPDLDASIVAYTSFLSAEVLESGPVTSTQAQLWGKPRLEGCTLTTLASPTGHPWLRLLGIPGQRQAQPFRELGWMALEVLVEDVVGLAERCRDAPFNVVRSPTGDNAVLGMQVTGPAGEVLYLTQILESQPPFDIAPARAVVDRLMAPVSACLRRDEGLSVYNKLGATGHWTFDTTLGSVNRAHGLDASLKHPCATVKLAGHSMVEINQLGLARARPPSGGLLPTGIAIVSFVVDNLDNIGLTPIYPPQTLPGKLYAGQRVAACRGAAGELIELIEAAG